MNGKQKQKIGFSFAWNGLKEVFKSEVNFRIHSLATLVVVIVGFLLKLSQTEWIVICLTITFVLVAETINSAIEKTIDYISPNIHPTAKQIKDISAGAVLLTAIVAIIIGLIIFLPKFYQLVCQMC